MNVLMLRPLVCGVILLVATTVAHAALADGIGCADEDDGVVVVRTGGSGEEGTATITLEGGEDGQAVMVFSTAVAGETEGEAGKPVQLLVSGDPDMKLSASRIVVATGAADGDPSGGWLGVSLDEPNPALAAQLGLEDEGVVVVNVVKDSPADGAGLQRYDIITSIDGDGFGKSVEELAKRISEAGAGNTTRLTVLRAGKEMSIDVTLGSRPEPRKLVWEFDHPDMPSILDSFSTTGQFIKVGPDGEIMIEDLGDLKEIAELPDALRVLIPDVDDMSTQIWVNANDTEGSTHITTRVVRDDESVLEIEREGDGPIIVRRTTVDDNGDEQTIEQTYDTPEDLQAADEEAYDIYTDVQGPHAVHLGVTKDTFLQGGDLKNVFRFKMNDGTQTKEWQAEVRKSVEEARKAFDEAMKLSDPAQSVFKTYAWPGANSFGWYSNQDVTHNFSVDDNGRIEIRLRKGDSEVVLSYENAADLEARNPELYDKFADVIDSAAAEK